ncbi:MAG: iron-containing alcohol dehydrogenase [Lishizhenia sp.]
MDNFDYYNPTKVIFGKDTYNRLEAEIKAHTTGQTVLLTYGGGSIKKNGVYQKVVEALQNFNVIEFSGIEANPEYETCMKAVEIAKKESVDFILAVGGGSVIDATKFIAAAALFEGEPWDVLSRVENKAFSDSIAFGTVLTLPATGSEMNSGAVISRSALKEKRTMGGVQSFPKFSFLDPTVVATLPTKQIANGITDAFMHTLEQYLTFPSGNKLQERIAEGILQTLIEFGPKVLREPSNYEYAANLMWCATMALNGTLRAGVAYDWSTHMIGHELTALHGIDHARTLAIIAPNLYQVKFENKKEKLAQYAERVWGSNANKAQDAIVKTKLFFESLGIETSVSAYDSDNKQTPSIIKQRFIERGWVAIGEKADLTPEQVEEIVTMAL